MVELQNGRYAVIDPKDKILKFYKISIGKNKWQGYIFLSVFASSDVFPIKNYEHRTIILNEIKKNPLEAMARYGKEVGKCAICDKMLTDEESRTRGVGPVCWAKMK